MTDTSDEPGANRVETSISNPVLDELIEAATRIRTACPYSEFDTVFNAYVNVRFLSKP
jgi:hypothetical protein